MDYFAVDFSSFSPLRYRYGINVLYCSTAQYGSTEARWQYCTMIRSGYFYVTRPASAVCHSEPVTSFLRLYSFYILPVLTSAQKFKKDGHSHGEQR